MSSRRNERDHSIFLKSHALNMHDHNGNDQRNIRGKGTWIKQQSDDMEFYGQLFHGNEDVGSKHTEPDKGSHRTIHGFEVSRSYKGDSFGSRINYGHRKRQKLHGHHRQGHSLHDVRSSQRRYHFHGQEYFHHDVVHHKDAKNSTNSGGGWKFQSCARGRWIKDKVSPPDHGKKGGRGHFLYRRYKATGHRYGINGTCKFVDSQFKPNDLSPADMNIIEQPANKKKDHYSDSLPCLSAAKDSFSRCMDSKFQEECCIESPSSNCDTQLPSFQQAVLPVEAITGQPANKKTDHNTDNLQYLSATKDSHSRCTESKIQEECRVESPSSNCDTKSSFQQAVSPVEPISGQPANKKKDHYTDSIQYLNATKDSHSRCTESKIQEECCFESPSSNCDTQSPSFQQAVLPAEAIPTQKDNNLVCGNQKGLERAFIFCAGGSMKRRRLSAVRDFPVQSGKLRTVSAKKVIVKPNIKKSNVAESLMLQESCKAGSDPELTTANEISSIRKIMAAPAQCHFVDTEVATGDCNKRHSQIINDSPDLGRNDFEAIIDNGSMKMGNSSEQLPQKHMGSMLNNSDTSIFPIKTAREPKGVEGNEPAVHLQARLAKLAENRESLNFLKGNASKPSVAIENFSRELSPTSTKEIVEKCNSSTILKEGARKRQGSDKSSSIELSQCNPERVVKSCNLLSPFEENSGEEKVSELLKVNNTESWSITSIPKKDVGLGKCHEMMDLDCAELVQGSYRKDMKSLEKSVDVSSHLSIPITFDVSERDVVQTQVQENQNTMQKERKNSSTLYMDAGGCVSKSKFRPTKVSAALIDELSDKLHKAKRMKAHDPLEAQREIHALVICKSMNKSMVENNDVRVKIEHRGSSREKMFQTSKSLKASDASKLLKLEAAEGLSDRSLVKRTLHEFESIRKSLVKSQNNVRRADLEAGCLLRERGRWRNCGEKIIGDVPGVEVGDQFSFRMEMLVIGLHRQVQAGIDYISGTKRQSGSSLATSIVASGGYEDDKDDGNTLIYSGQGGFNMKGNKKQESNQELVRGNLALSNSMKEKAPVRVIRGTADLASPSSKVYTYDGLYDVVNCSFECGAAGFRVYQFTLTRRSGQPQVGLSFLSNLKKKGLSRPNLLLHDISAGQERLPVCVVNEIDEEPAPIQFSYISSMKYPAWYLPVQPKGCQCIGVCDEQTCSCGIKNGGELPYNEKGYILRDKEAVYECGPLCSCSSSCENRVSQKGLRYRLEIFKTKNRGWGVRSLDSIQPGGFICEYTGELLSDAEAEQRIENDEYLFDLGNKCKQPVLQSELEGEYKISTIFEGKEDIAYTIDAKSFGNVARFINHSCSPNLYAQNVLYDSDDLRFPHVMLFAMENIPPMRELTYDYNYSLDQVRDALGNVKTKACYCGAQDCQGRLY